MKKILAILLAVAMLASLGITAFADEEPIHLTLWTFQELHTQLYKEMLDKWNANPDNPKLDIDMQVYPYEDMHNKLTIALQSGEGAPDIVDIEINMFANYLKGDIQLAELNDIVEPMEDHLVMSRFNNYAKDGKFYGIDHHIGACIVWYNTEILEEAGIDYKDIKTWDDYHEAGKVVLEKTGTAVACPGGNHHSEEYYGWMNAGNCASVSMPFWYLNRFTDYMPDLSGKMKVAPMPLWSDGGHKSAQMGGTGTAVVKTSPNVDIAKEWLAYATLSFEGCVNTWLILGFDPIMTDVYGSEEMKAPNKFFDYYDDTIFDMLKTILDDIPDTCLTEYFPAAADIVRNQMAYDLVIGGKDPEAIAKDCAEELRGMIF